MSRIPRGSLPRAAVFVLVVLLVVASAAAVPYLTAPDGGERTADYPEYSASNLVPDRASAEGIPSVERADEPGVVLVDSAHANRFEQEDIQPLLSAIAATGYRVEILQRADNFERALSRADALLVVDPALAYTESEIDRVDSFVESGGRLVMLGEPVRSRIGGGGPIATVTTVRNQLDPLATRFGIEFGTGYLFNMGANDGNFQNVFADAAGRSQVTKGVDRAAVYTATPVQVTDGSELLVATEGTRNVRGDALGEYPVAVSTGDVLAIGDTSFLQRGNYNVVDNERLIANVATFLTSGERDRALAEYPYVVGSNPRIAYTAPGLLDAAQRVATDLGGQGARPTLSLARGSVSASKTDVLITTFEHLQANEIEGPGTGITVRGGQVAVPGYSSAAGGVAVVRTPEQGIDLVIAVGSPAAAKRVARILANGNLNRYIVTDRTAVIRSP